jgi:hypothetical protein
MKLGHSADEIKYDATIGTIARYLLILDGEHTMTIQCDSADPDKVINILDANGDRCQATKGRFTITTKLLEGPDGEPLGTETRVDEKSVYMYVIPRLHVLLGRLLRTACPNCND